MTTNTPEGFTAHALSEPGCEYSLGALPPDLEFSAAEFERAWNLHPDWRPLVLHGRYQTRRWQSAYCADYSFSGQKALALPLPGVLKPIAKWAHGAFGANAVLLNWYNPLLGDLINPHFDDPNDLKQGSVIVTVSLGGSRQFHFSKEGQETTAFDATDRSVVVIPWVTNSVKKWKHGVAQDGDERRISITFRTHKKFQYSFDIPSAYAIVGLPAIDQLKKLRAKKHIRMVLDLRVDMPGPDDKAEKQLVKASVGYRWMASLCNEAFPTYTKLLSDNLDILLARVAEFLKRPEVHPLWLLCSDETQRGQIASGLWGKYGHDVESFSEGGQKA